MSVGTISSRSNLKVTVFCLLVSNWHSTVIDWPSPLLTDRTVSLMAAFLRFVPERFTRLLSEVATLSEFSGVTLENEILIEFCSLNYFSLYSFILTHPSFDVATCGCGCGCGCSCGCGCCCTTFGTTAADVTI